METAILSWYTAFKYLVYVIALILAICISSVNLGFLVTLFIGIMTTSFALNYKYNTRMFESKTKYGHLPRVADTTLLHMCKRFVPEYDFYQIIRAMKLQISGHVPPILYHGLYLDGTHVVSVSDATLFKQILNDMVSFPKSKGFYDAYSIVVGRSIVNRAGKQWQKQRRILTPLFQSKKLESYVKIMIDSTKYCLSKFKDASNDGKVDVVLFDNKDFKDVVLRSILHVAFGSHCDLQDLSTNYRALWESMKIWVPVHLVFGAFTRYVPIPWSLFGLTPVFESMANLNEITRSYIEKQRKILMSDGESEAPKDLITMLVHAQLNEVPDGLEPITDDLIMDEVNAFLLAGHDTATNSISMCMQLIAEYPELQELIHCEIDKGFANQSLDSFQNFEMIEKTFPLVLATFKETLRLCPPVPVFDRYIPDEVMLGKVRIPAETTILLWNINVHRCTKTWNNAECFIPERFLDEGQCGSCRPSFKNYVGSAKAVLERNSFAFIPFLGGSRKCIGIRFVYQEAILLLAAVLQEYDATLVQRGYMAFEATVKPSKMMVSLTKRIPK